MLIANKSSQEDIRPQVILALGNCEEEFIKDAIQIIKEDHVSMTKRMLLVDESIDKTLNKTSVTRFNQFIHHYLGCLFYMQWNCIQFLPFPINRSWEKR